MGSFYKIALFSIVVLCSINATAQKFVIEKVSVADLEQKKHPTDTSAVAAILFKKGDVKFVYTQQDGFKVVTKVKTRIKIYKKEGYEWANHSHSYYIATSSKENVSYSDANTYNLVNGTIVKTKLKSDGEFDENINKFWSQKKITMPSVKEGSIIEYEYTVTSPNYGTLEEWNFQTGIPVNYSEYVTTIPEYFTYTPNQKGYIFPKISTEKNFNSIVISSKERVSDGRTVSTNFSNDKIDYQEVKTTYIAQNVPAINDESFVNNIRNYLSSISHELASTRFPNSIAKYYTMDWASVTSKIYENDDFGAELNKTGYFESDINALLSGITDDMQKVTAIFNHVKANVKWNDYNGYSCHDGVRKAYKDKTGNVAEINLMLTAMLRYAGLNANPVLLSTRSNGIAFFPNRSAFNYVIAAVEVKGDNILLDATEKFSVPSILPYRDLNWHGRLMRKDATSVEIDLMPKGISKEGVNMVYKIDNQGTVAGKFRKQLTDHYALSYRKKNVGINQDNYLETLENNNNKIEIDEYTRENENDLTKPVIETYSFKSNNNVEVIGDKIYFSPLLFLATETNPFKQEKREYPIDFGYPTESKYNITVEIPEGFTIESVPQPINLATENKIGTFKYNIANNGNKIQISIASNINLAIVGPEYYITIKDYFQKMIDKENEKIVLKKI